jgi:hypothetical protein
MSETLRGRKPNEYYNKMNDLAKRIWANQSPDMPAVWRIQFIENALLDKNYTAKDLKKLNLHD